MTLTPEVHTLLYQTLGLTLYSCLYFSGLDSSTGLLYSKQTSYLLSFIPFRCSTSCLPHGLPSDDSDSRGTHSSTWINTFYSCLYFRSTLQLLRYASFLQDFVIMNFQFFRCTLLNHDSLNSSNKYSSTPPLRLWYVCVLCVVCVVCVIVHACSWLPLWAGLGGSCFCNFKSFTSSTSTLRLFDSSTHRLFKLFMFVCPFSFGCPSGWVCGMGIFVSHL